MCLTGSSFLLGCLSCLNLKTYPKFFSRFSRASTVCLLAAMVLLAPMFSGIVRAGAAGPRIVNIYNFVRENDYRLPDSEAVLYEATAQQVRLLKQAGLPATFALQYDALMNTNYQTLFKEQLGRNCEIGAWWELPQMLIGKAGLKWRGHHEWDSTANIGFSPGYTPAERCKLVDVYMADFKKIFGCYPRTVGSWYIDEVTLAYMVERYGIVASCNCKDQIGTDGYTLWGGYWNQAYYPSRLNAYMPAQSRAGQINVPIFRMLGSDPIYQHGTTPGMFTLEPVYPASGGSAKWQSWFFDNLIHQPSLAFAYTQAGQENSFGWNAMAAGFTRQLALLAEKAQAGEVEVKTLAEAGRWFQKRYSLTPPTAVVALTDWKNEGRKTVWYDSRFYRLNILWQDGVFFIRDLHCFDEGVVSPAHDVPLAATSLACETLPIMDFAQWSAASTEKTGIWPVLVRQNGGDTQMIPAGAPQVTELKATDLRIQQSLAGGGIFSVVCTETNVTFTGEDGGGHPLPWALRLAGGQRQEAVVQAVEPERIRYRYLGTDYQLRLVPGSGTCREDNTRDIIISPNGSGTMTLDLTATNKK